MLNTAMPATNRLQGKSPQPVFFCDVGWVLVKQKLVILKCKQSSQPIQPSTLVANRLIPSTKMGGPVQQALTINQLFNKVG